MKIFRLDVFFWMILIITGAGWYISENSNGWKIAFLLIAGFYLFLSFIIRAVFLQRLKENQKITEL